jgi:hypothetical protein
MDECKPHHVIVEQLISDARQGGHLYELRRQLDAIDGRPMPDPETSPNPQPRPARRKSKGRSR